MTQNSQTFDVLVCGGGVAGIAAALAAARGGMKTALVEKTIFPGGLATSGLINIFLPLCDGCGHQVTAGIAEELMHRSLRYGPGMIPAWQASSLQKPGPRYRVNFSSAAFTLALDEALEEAGVEVWLDTLACTPVMDGNRVAGVEVETKEGRVRFAAGCVVDATGDADIAWRAGAPCEQGLNSLALWAQEFSADPAAPAGSAQPNSGKVVGIRIGAHANSPDERTDWTGVNARDVTRFAMASRTLMRERYHNCRKDDTAAWAGKSFPVALPALAQFRTTRRIQGLATINPGEQSLVREDSIGLVADWRTPGPVWEIPYGALIPQNVQGLLTAGRCIASAGDAWEITRVIPAVALTGQAAGLAAALAVETRTRPHAVPAEKIQLRLGKAGIPFHTRQVLA